MKFRPVVAELFLADRQRGMHDEAVIHFSEFCESASKSGSIQGEEFFEPKSDFNNFFLRFSVSLSPTDFSVYDRVCHHVSRYSNPCTQI